LLSPIDHRTGKNLRAERAMNVRFGQKRTLALQKVMSALPPKADYAVH
jgi:hypothetical protein